MATTTVSTTCEDRGFSFLVSVQLVHVLQDFGNGAINAPGYLFSRTVVIPLFRRDPVICIVNNVNLIGRYQVHGQHPRIQYRREYGLAFFGYPQLGECDDGTNAGETSTGWRRRQRSERNVAPTGLLLVPMMRRVVGLTRTLRALLLVVGPAVQADGTWC